MYTKESFHDSALSDNASAKKDALQSKLLSMAGGIEAHAERVQTLIKTLKHTSDGNEDFTSLDERKIRNIAGELDLFTKGKTKGELAAEIANILLESIPHTASGFRKLLSIVTPPERIRVWEELSLLTAGADHTTCDTADQIVRMGITFITNSLAGNFIASDCLYGTPERSTSTVNLDSLKADTVNIAINGHSSSLVVELLNAARQENTVNIAEEAGAAGIQFYGIDRSGTPSLAASDDIVHLTSPKGAGLALATGAIDLLLADSQYVFPGLLDVAACYQTIVISTDKLNILPGAEYLGSPDDENTLAPELAGRIVSRAIDSFKTRRSITRHIPSARAKAVVGFSLETIDKHYGCMERVSSALIDGRIRGIVCLSGCAGRGNDFDNAAVSITDMLLKNNILVFTNGCAALPLVAQGYCSTEAQTKCGDMLQLFLGQNMPPVWHFGGCIDSAHILATFREIAKYAGRPIKELPFAAVIPGWSNETDAGAALAFHVFGINSYLCASSPVTELGSVLETLHKGKLERLGSRMCIEIDPESLAQMIISDIVKTRSELCWR